MLEDRPGVGGRALAEHVHDLRRLVFLPDRAERARRMGRTIAQRAAHNRPLDTAGCANDRGNVVAEYTEVETGKRSDRPKLAEALAHARKARATLVIAKLDRLARNVHFVSGLMESGVPFDCADRPGADPFRLHIEAAIAEGAIIVRVGTAIFGERPL